MNSILLLVIPLLVLLAPVPPAVALLRNWTHPSRLVLEALSTGFTLVVIGAFVPLTGGLMVLWWAVLALFVTGAVAASRRATTAPPPLGEGTSARGQALAQPVGARALLGTGLLWGVVVGLALLGG